MSITTDQTETGPEPRDVTVERNLLGLQPEFTQLLRELIPEIGDDYRASDDTDDAFPGMCVTIACDEEGTSWNYQTGDNCYTGGAYGLPHWAVISLYRDSDPAELAREACEQLADLILS